MKLPNLQLGLRSAAALMAIAGTLSAASFNAYAQGEYIVSSQVVSDEVASPSDNASVYVGDMPSCGCETAGCDNCGTCSSCGECSSCGDCGSCGDLCGNGCGSCGDGCGSCGCGKASLLSGFKCGPNCCNESDRCYGKPDLFFNYYTQGNANQANAQMYLSPLPVPPNVGHTFNTYQPFYPHEMLYWHKDRFHKYYDCGRGMNRTRAIYYSPPIRQAISNLYWNKLRLPR